MPAKRAKKTAPKKTVTATSLDSKVYAACDIMRRSNCSGAMNYIPELSWILFLRILDDLEEQEEARSATLGVPFTPSLVPPFRWRDWASKPPDDYPNGDGPGWKRRKLTEGVLDKIDGIRQDAIDDTHVFTLSQVYEGLLADLGSKAGDGGQFFTPREIIRAVVKIIDPKIGETVYDPSCGTGGFLAQAFDHMRGEDGGKIRSARDLEALRQETFYGREKENLIYPIALSNLVLHGIDLPHLWHGNTLTNEPLYDGLWEGAPPQFDVILSNPPFGGKEGRDAQADFAFQTKATQILFLQHVIDNLNDGGRCGIVLDEGVLFRTTEDAFIRTKRKLLEECDLWCIVSLPGGAFSGAGAGVKTNLLFFTKGKPTTKIWYYDLSDLKVGKRTPFTLDRFEDLFKLLPERGGSDRSWTIDFLARREQASKNAAPFKAEAEKQNKQIEEFKEKRKQFKKGGKNDDVIAKIDVMILEAFTAAREAENRASAILDTVYDLKAVNPTAVSGADARSVGDLLEIIAGEGRKIDAALRQLKG